MLIVEAPRSKRTLEQLFNNEYWKDIFVGSMLNFFPFDKDDIRKIGYQELCHNSNAEWDVETLCQYVKECAKHFDRYEWLNILHNRKFTWDDNLLDKTGASSYDWIYLWLSKLSNVKWTNTFILKHCECFDWGQLTLNPNITWTEKLLFEVEDKIVWSNLIGNPNVKWSRKIIERVKKALEQVHAYAENYNFYKEYVDLAISCGFNPFTSFNIFENAIGYLKQFNLIRSDEEFNKVVWDALSKNPNIPWTIEDLRNLDKINLDKLIYSKNKLPLELVDLINIKQYFTKRHNSYKDGEFLLRIELEDDLFWNPEHIKQLTHYHHFNSEAGYCSDLISYNDSVRWNYDLFVFIRDYGLYWDEQFKPLTEREKFFDFLMDDYGKKELLDFFRGIYNPNRFYTLENKFTQL